VNVHNAAAARMVLCWGVSSVNMPRRGLDVEEERETVWDVE
jgi:hypothetical protein